MSVKIEGGCHFGQGIVLCEGRYGLAADVRFCDVCKGDQPTVVKCEPWHGMTDICCNCGAANYEGWDLDASSGHHSAEKIAENRTARLAKYLLIYAEGLPTVSETWDALDRWERGEE